LRWSCDAATRGGSLVMRLYLALRRGARRRRAVVGCVSGPRDRCECSGIVPDEASRSARPLTFWGDAGLRNARGNLPV